MSSLCYAVVIFSLVICFIDGSVYAVQCMPAQPCLFAKPMDCSLPGSSVHGIFQVKNTGVGCHFLLQGIFLTQGSNPCLWHLLHWQANSLPLSHLGSPVVCICQSQSPNSSHQPHHVQSLCLCLYFCFAIKHAITLNPHFMY